MELTDLQKVLQFCRQGHKHQAVTFIMELKGMRFAEAQKYVDNLEKEANEHSKSKQNKEAIVLYKVYPADPTLLKDEAPEPTIPVLLIIIQTLATIIGFVYFFINLFSGGYQWLVCLAILIICIISSQFYIRKGNIKYREQKVILQAEMYSNQLNELLVKSSEIVDDILPYFEGVAIKQLQHAKKDFSDNVISPFWDNIEETSRQLAYFKEAVEQLIFNGELYSKILYDKKHNFPRQFPIGTDYSISQSLLDDYNSIIRKAQSKFEFANIWEHRKTQKILIAGFQTLAQAINNMKQEILAAIHNLDHSMKSEFRELKNIQIEQIRTYEAGYAALNQTLTSMDTKLYYLQYNKKPITTFIRPLFD